MKSELLGLNNDRAFFNGKETIRMHYRDKERETMIVIFHTRQKKRREEKESVGLMCGLRIKN